MAWIVEKTQGYVFRKIIHFALNAFLAYLAYFLQPSLLFPAALTVFAAISVGEFIRLNVGPKHVVSYAIEPMLKRKEKKELTGVFWAALGAVVVSPFVSTTAMSFALLVFAVSDPAAAIVGKYTRSPKIYKRKTVNGSLAFLLASVGASLWFLSAASLPPSKVALLVFFSLFLTLVEIYCDPIDDNLLILSFGALFAHFVFTI